MIRYVSRPPILERLPNDQHAVIEASAGTGKTFTIEHLVVDCLITARIPLEEILVVTFTEKATDELKARIRALLERVLSGRTERPPTGPHWTVDPAARRRLENALLQFDRAAIHTIHGFCQRVLTEHAFEGGRLFDQTHVDGGVAFRNAFHAALRGPLSTDPGHRAVLEAWLDQSSVEQLGKLLYACHKAHAPIWADLDGPALNEVLAALRDRLTGPEGWNAIRSAIERSSIHGSDLKYLIRAVDRLIESLRAADGDGIRFLARFDEWHHLKKVEGARSRKSRSDDDYVWPDDLPEPVLHLRKLVARLRTLRIPFESAIVDRFLPVVRGMLERRKLEEGLFDFDDMLLLVRDALRSEQGADLRASLEGRYRRALIDEFQDTDAVQWDIFKSLFFDRAPERLLYLVGDPKQAIYGFRGADVHVYEAARAEILDAGGALVPLTRNFRSSPALLDVTNAIFDSAADPPFFSDPAITFRSVGCGNPDRALRGGDGQPLAPLRLVNVETGGRVTKRKTIEQIGPAFAREIRRLIAPEAPAEIFEEGGWRPLTPRDIFILTRTNPEGRDLVPHLRQADIPFAFYKEEGLFQSAEAEEIRILLEAIARPGDWTARHRAWMTSFFAVDPADWEACRTLPRHHPLHARLDAWHGMAEDREFEELFSSILSESGLRRREILLGESERPLTNVQHIFEILLEEAGQRESDIHELIRLLVTAIEEPGTLDSIEGNVQRLESERDAVQIMSMHKSKGLEAPVVFVWGGFSRGRSGRVNFFHAPDGQRHIYVGKPVDGSAVKEAIRREQREEEERLFYVTLTRAATRLVLPFVEEGRIRGPYDHLNKRLRTLLDDDRLPNVDWKPPEAGERAPHRDVPSRPAGEDVVPFDLLGTDSGPNLAALRRRHAAPTQTSYTRLRKGWGASEEPSPIDRFEAEEEEETSSLPGGAITGLFLHEAIETLSFATFAHAEEEEEWSRLPSVRDTVRRALDRHGLDPELLDPGLRLLHRALTSPVRLGPLLLSDGFADCRPNRREVSFLYPVSWDPVPVLSGRLTGEDGFVRGVFDFLFEREGRAFLVDWKSDRLPDYGPGGLRQHVSEHYRLQADLYLLALVRMLNVRTRDAYERLVGGIGYCFLRGVGTDPEAGCFFLRPTWDELKAREESLQPLAV